MTRLAYFTDLNGLQRILATGEILESAHARGNGVYATLNHPAVAPRERIEKSIDDDGWRNVFQGTEYAIELDPAGFMQLGDGNHMCVHPGTYKLPDGAILQVVGFTGNAGADIQQISGGPPKHMSALIHNV